MKELSEYYSDDEMRKAVILSDGVKYVIRKYIRDNLVESEEYHEHTLQTVEDEAEDWAGDVWKIKNF